MPGRMVRRVKNPLQIGETIKDLDPEYIYYIGILKELSSECPNPIVAQNSRIWLRKLMAPHYGSPLFKEKRNRYLCALSICLMNIEMAGVFQHAPPDGPLAEVKTLAFIPMPEALWETSTQWIETLEGIRGFSATFSQVPCNIHTPQNVKQEHRTCPRVLSSVNTMFDEEFQLCLYISRPYVSMITKAEHKAKAASWMQLLCTVDMHACPVMKSVRNDYMQSLMGYVYELRVAGPFLDYPLWGRLYPLADAARFSANKHPFTDPRSRDAIHFLREVDIPKEGAFCYVAVTGELISSVVPDPKPFKEAVKKAVKKSRGSAEAAQQRPPLTSLSLSLDPELRPLSSSTPTGGSTPKRNSLVEPAVKEKDNGSPGGSFVNQMR